MHELRMGEDLTNWTPSDVAEFVRNAGYSQYANAFEDAEISGPGLPYITEEHLAEIGIDKIGPRLRILRLLQSKVGTHVIQQAQAPPSKTLPPPQRITRNSEQSASMRRPTTTTQSGSRARASVSASTSSMPAAVEEEIPKYKRDHDKIMEAIRRGRKIDAYEKAREAGRAVGPPPEPVRYDGPNELVNCPHCGRRFSEKALQHHIGACARNGTSGFAQRRSK